MILWTLKSVNLARDVRNPFLPTVKKLTPWAEVKVYLARCTIGTSVEEHNRVGVFRSVDGHDGSGPDLYPLLFVDPSALDPQRVLVHSDDLLVLENRLEIMKSVRD